MDHALRIDEQGQLRLGEGVLAAGDEVEVLWRGKWMRGRVKCCPWKVGYRLVLADLNFFELVTGMQARWVLEE